MLASVTCLHEAELAMAGGADIIDCKDPRRGALGALAPASVAAIRAGIPRAVISATIGDLPPLADALVSAALEMAATGVDYVKVGFFPGGDAVEAIRALGAAFPVRLAEGGSARLVGVLLADRDPDFSLVEVMAEAGFAAVMIDTAGKRGRSLPDILGHGELAAFVRAAHSQGLAAGLAGSLQAGHVAELSTLGADILGFRGALCSGSDRRGAIDAACVGQVRAVVSAAPAARERNPALARQEELHP